MMSTQVVKKYVFEDFWLEPETKLLLRNGEAIHLPTRPFRLLLHLVENRDRFVGRRELLDMFWEGRDVYDEGLTKCVGRIRKALNDQQESPRFIETRYADGYRFIGALEDEELFGDSSIVEIERTRDVKIVLEKEELESASTNDHAQGIDSHPSTLSVDAPSARRRSLPAALVLIATVVTVGALVAYRARGRNSVGVPPNLTAISSLAVLPLKNVSHDPASEYFSDGMTDSLITALAKIDGLRVVSRGSVFTLKDKEANPREVGKRLGVGALLEGTVDRTDKDIRVAVRLVSTNDGGVLWTSENYKRPLGDTFVIQDEIARGVTSGLRLKLTAQSAQRVTQHYTNNREAYESYLKGRYFWNERTIPNSLNKAISSFKDAVQKDPNYALAYSGLADSYIMSFWYAPQSSNDALVKAREAATMALRLDDTLSEVHTSMAAIAENEWNWTAAQTEFERAIELDPNYATAHHWYALYLAGFDKPEQAIEEIRRARDSDPLSLPINADVGYVFFCLRRYDEAITEYQKALALNADFPMALEGMALTYVKSGHLKEAVELIDRLPEESAICDKGYIYGVAGERAKAKNMLAKIMRRWEREYVSPQCIAMVYSGLNDKGNSLFWLEKAYREHAPDLSLLGSPFYDGLRTDPRFLDLERRVGMEERPPSRF
jgi:TolB-like protein/DNA-binding winged helix-turn-helix (wHTH) protein/Tfp pilus assembly protein PilF